MMKLIRKTVMHCALYTISTLTGILMLLRITYLWCTSPSGTIFKNKKRPIPPSCLNDPALGEHKYVQLKNVKLHYVEKGDPNKPLMLFLHGFPEFWYSWRHQIKEFSKDYWVIAPDLRGYGDSEKPYGTKYYQIKYLCEDIKNLCDALERDKLTIVAHDWGGVIMWYFVILYSEMIDTYVVMNAPHPLTFRKHLMNNLTQLRMSWYVFFFQLPYLPELFLALQDLKFLNVVFRSTKKPSPFTEEDKEAFRFTFGKPGATTPPLNYYRANIIPSSDFLKSLPKNPKLPPGLLLFGENDVAIHINSIMDVKQKVPNLTIEIIKDASHFVQQDDPETVNRLMREFFEKLPKLKAEENKEINEDDKVKSN